LRSPNGHRWEWLRNHSYRREQGDLEGHLGGDAKSTVLAIVLGACPKITKAPLGYAVRMPISVRRTEAAGGRSRGRERIPGRVSEPADEADLKSAGVIPREGSKPSSPTK